MNAKVTISISEHITENFKSLKVPFYKLGDLVKSRFNYTAGVFKDNYRKADNYQSYCDVLILDIDGGLTIEEAKKVFEPFSYIIATTKSHLKDKNGEVCDRYRVLIPFDTPMYLDKHEFSKTMEQVYKKYPFVDSVCKDSSRFYFPSKDSKVITHEGFCYFYWEDFYYDYKQEELKKIEIDERKKALAQSFGDNKPEYGDGEKIDYIRKISKTEKLLQLLKYDEKFISGQRNKTLYSYGKYFEDLGFEDEETKDVLLWINSQGDSIPEEEIVKTVFKSLRLNG